jgi:drug/metabolite transporter (DMT)-like permease
VLAALLALLAAASWGASDFAGGITTRLSSAVVAVLLTQGVGLALAAILLIASAEPMPSQEALAWAAAAGVSGVLGLALFYLALSRGTMGLVAPLTALLAAAIPAAVGLLGGDDAGLLDIAGMVAALVAVVLISLPDRRLGGPVLPTFHGSRVREWLLILGASLCFAGFFLGVDASHTSGGEVWWPLFAIKLVGVACVGLAILVAWLLGRVLVHRVPRAALRTGTLGGTGDFAGNVFFVMANDLGQLSVVVVLVSLYPIGTALLARLFLHERLGPVRMAGVALAILGVMLIGLGAL